jgi:hypothetical protein
MSTRWGYKKDGEACLFELPDGQQLPSGWSENHMVIEAEANRTAEAITEHAGTSVTHPVKVIAGVVHETPSEEKPHMSDTSAGATFPGPFHRDPAPTEAPRRGPGRPPLSKGE